MGFLFITHDLAIAKYFAWQGQIGVMYLGRIVEFGPTPQVVGNPGHPYTRALLGAVPEADPILTRSKERITLQNQNIPSLLNLPPACTFHPRCPLFSAGLCDTIEPALLEYDAHQIVACHITTGRVADARAGRRMSPAVGRAAFALAIFVAVTGVLLLPFLDRNSAEFVVTVLEHYRRWANDSLDRHPGPAWAPLMQAEPRGE